MALRLAALQHALQQPMSVSLLLAWPAPSVSLRLAPPPLTFIPWDRAGEPRRVCPVMRSPAVCISVWAASARQCFDTPGAAIRFRTTLSLTLPT